MARVIRNGRWTALMLGALGVFTVLLLRGGLFAQVVPPSVSTDKTGYLVGEPVAISGVGFQPDEAVTLTVTLADGSSVPNGSAADFDAILATGAGTFSATWTLEENLAGHNLKVTAVGATSGTHQSDFGRIATVQTDRYDYQPGEIAIITGAGFRPGETVAVQVVHSNGLDTGAGHLPFPIVAQADGSIATPWYVNPDDSLDSIFRVIASGTDSGLVATTTFTDVLVSIVDDGGPDDLGGQKDLTAMSFDPGPSAVGITWNWDDTARTGNNSSDACVLVDTDADGNANWSLCVVAGGSPLTFSSRHLYSCNDSRTDRCAGPTEITSAIASIATASVVSNVDPFRTVASHITGNQCNATNVPTGQSPAGCRSADLVANVTLALSDVGGAAARVINVCAYNSPQPNSDPSDCVITPPSGFLTIVKNASENGTPFTFTSSEPARSGATSWTITPTSGTAAVVQIPFALSTTLDLTEAIPATWKLTNVSCAIQTATPTSTGTPPAALPVVGVATAGVTNLEIRSGLETICTFTDAKQQGSIQIVKNTSGGLTGQSYTFGFTPSGFASNTPFNLTTTGFDGTASSTVYGGLAPSSATVSYSVSESTIPSGWDLTSSACTISGAPAGTIDNITVQDGQTTICTFTNSERLADTRGKIVVVKATNPASDPTSFGFIRTYESAGFTLTGQAPNNTNESGFLAPSDIAGAYTVSENSPLPSGWIFSSLTCSVARTNAGDLDPTLSSWLVTGQSVDVTLGAGDTVTCTFTNSAQGSIQIVKNTVGGNGTFSFTPGGFGSGAFDLTTSGGTASQTFSNVTAGSSYTISEADQAGWDEGTFTCSAGTPAAIQVTAGQTTTCTITNTKKGTLVVDKVTDPTGDPTVFSITATGSGTITGDGAGSVTDATNQSYEVTPGTYSVAETVPAGWDKTGDTCQNVEVAAGQTVTCTLTNTKRGTIVVDKVTNPAGDSQSFDFTAGGTGYTNFSLTDAAAANSQSLAPGSYSISETVPAGWDQTSATCTGAGNTTASITLSAGQTVTCTFTNTKRGSLTVQKTTLPASDPTSFTIAASGSGSITGGGAGSITDATDKVYEVTPGTYAVTETVPAGWDETSNTCSDVVVAAGANATCVITNTKRGSITIIKNTTGGDETFSFTSDFGVSSLTTVSGTATSGATSVAPGTFSITETVPTGWDLTSATCSDGSLTTAIAVAAGENVTCTFANTKRGSITIIKNTTGGDGTFSFTSDFGVSSLTTVSGTATSGAASVAPGTFSIIETVPTGWDQTSATCDDGSLTTAIAVAAGENVTCTFANTKRGSITVVKNTTGGEGTFTFTSDFGVSSLTTAGGTATSGATSVAPGTYSITETVPSGWDLTSATCSDSSPTTAIAVAAGENVTCTFANTKRGSITIVKNTAGGDATFTFTGTVGVTSITTSGGTGSAAPVLKAPGTYSIAETVPAGWDLASATCDDGSAPASIGLAAGESVTCTFANVKRGALIVDKVTYPAGDLTNFSIMANATAGSIIGTATGTITDATSKTYVVTPGIFTVSETAVMGWDQTSNTCVNVAVAAGETKTCTITNTKRGRILVVKQTVPDGDPTIFTFAASYDADGFTLKDNDPANDSGLLVPGSYNVSETLPSGWAAHSVTVSNNPTATSGTGILVTPGATVTVTFTNYRGSFATNSSLCVFDRDTSLPGQQFRSIFTQDVQAFPSYKMTATNPGQFFYNVFYSGTPGSTATFNITLPYPFVTQGAQPIHAYSSVSTTTVGGETCFVPAGNFFNASQPVTLANYTNGTYQNASGGNSLGTHSFPVTVTVPASGFVYLNMHLDYGLKGSIGYGNSNNNAVRFTSISTPPLEYLAPDLANHTFSVGGAQTGSSTTENQNSFKRNPGVGGLVRTAGLSPVGGATVTLKRGATVIGTALTDEDGWYQIVYKHTGKEAPYVVTLSNGPGWTGATQNANVTLKANAYFNVDFTVP